MVERFDLRDGGREGRILAETVDILRELALDVEEMTANQLELEEYVEEIDTDLMSLEENLYSDDTDDDDELWDGDDPDEDTYIELECPVCELESSYNESLFNRDGIQLTCPHCGNIVFDSNEDTLVFDDEEDDGENDGYSRHLSH